MALGVYRIDWEVLEDRMFSGLAIGSGRPVRARSHEPNFADDRQCIGVVDGEPSLAEPPAEARGR